MKRSLYIEHRGREIYTGKIVKDTFYRNFAFSKAVLWQNKEVSMAEAVFNYVKDRVKQIVFIDTIKSEAYKIGIIKARNHVRVSDYGEGTQVYLKKALLDRTSMPDIPYVEFKVLIPKKNETKYLGN